MKLIIQIPCYNEAETLTIALNELPRHIDGIDRIEYLIINDGSKDDTVKVARAWGVNHIVNFRQKIKAVTFFQLNHLILLISLCVNRRV